MSSWEYERETHNDERKKEKQKLLKKNNKHSLWVDSCQYALATLKKKIQDMRALLVFAWHGISKFVKDGLHFYKGNNLSYYRN